LLTANIRRAATAKGGLAKEEAGIIVAEPNLGQRGKLLHPEKAEAYKMKKDALKINKSTAGLHRCTMGSGVLSQMGTGKNFGQMISNGFDVGRADV